MIMLACKKIDGYKIKKFIGYQLLRLITFLPNFVLANFAGTRYAKKLNARQMRLVNKKAQAVTYACWGETLALVFELGDTNQGLGVILK